MKLYFAHNFNNRIKFRKIELQLEKKLNIELYNPFYDDLNRKKEMFKFDNNKKQRFHINQKNANFIVQRDLTALAACDGLLTIVDLPSFGTTIEICNATLMKKPIYFISQKYINHAWIKVYATYRFRNIKEFKKFIIKERKNEKKKNN